MKIKYSNSDKVFMTFVYIILAFSFIVVLYPLYFVVIASFSDPVLVNSGQVWFYPRGLSIQGYSYVFRDNRIITGYINTLSYCLGYTTLTLVLTVLAAYPLSNRTLVGRRVFNFLIVFPMYFSGGLVPTYIVIRNLHLINKPILMCILGALSAFNIIITRTYFETNIPNELLDSAGIDGCNQAQMFTRVVLPLSKPILAVLALYSFVGQWNSFFNAMMFLNKSQYYPLQLVLRDILLQSQSLQDSSKVQSISDVTAAAEQQKLADMIKYCVIVVSSAPILCIFPFFQKYFAQGIMIGAVKG